MKASAVKRTTRSQILVVNGQPPPSASILAMLCFEDKSPNSDHTFRYLVDLFPGQLMMASAPNDRRVVVRTQLRR
jgi:hypothetical protein